MITEKRNISNQKRNFSPILMFIFCSFIFCGSQAKSIVNELNNLKKEHPDTKKKAIFELHKNGKKSIPLLIREISDNTKILCQIQNPKYSFYGEANTYFGVLSAFVIELIVGREKLSTENFLKSQFLLGMYDNYIYTRGVIIDEENRRSVKEGDLIKIRKVYADWWKKNKNKSIEQLRNDWEKNIKPLSGSKYHWE
jgi:hypothetical protein